MVRTFKFGEPSKIINFRVPVSRVSEFRAVVQKAIDTYYYSNETDFPEPKNGDFKRLYEIMNKFLIAKMSDKAISKIPEPIIRELEKMEEVYKFE